MGGPRCTCWPLQCLVWERDPSPPSWAVRLESTLPSQGRPWSGRRMTLGISPPCPALPSSPSLPPARRLEAADARGCSLVSRVSAFLGTEQPRVPLLAPQALRSSRAALILPFSSWVTLGKSLYLSESQFLDLGNKGHRACQVRPVC